MSDAWRPVKEYRGEFGRVVVWLEWPAYLHSQNRMESEGTWDAAYTIQLNDGSFVWVQAKDCIPIETIGRKVTHFMLPGTPLRAASEGK